MKHLHEVAWDNEFRYKKPEEFTKEDKKKIAEQEKEGITYRPIRSKQERGIALNRQKQNSIADMAAVLGGLGRGNKIITSESEEGVKELLGVTVNWANDQDKEYAEEWSSNVTHDLFEVPSYVGKAAEKVEVATTTTTTPPTPEAST